MYVQEVIEISGRVHRFMDNYDTLPEAVRRLRAFAYRFMVNLPKAQTETDNNTYVRVYNSHTARTFTIVNKRGGAPIPFGHLVNKKS